MTNVNQQYLKLFNCVQTNDWNSTELLVSVNNTWNYLNQGKQKNYNN